MRFPLSLAVAAALACAASARATSAQVRSSPSPQAGVHWELLAPGTRDTARSGPIKAVSGLSAETAVQNERSTSPVDRRVAAASAASSHAKFPEITLAFFATANDPVLKLLVPPGEQRPRDLLLRMMDRDGRILRTYRLVRAYVTKYTGPALNAKGNDVSMSELTLACEQIVVQS